jgi:hypothetical protein
MFTRSPAVTRRGRHHRLTPNAAIPLLPEPQRICWKALTNSPMWTMRPRVHHHPNRNQIRLTGTGVPAPGLDLAKSDHWQNASISSLSLPAEFVLLLHKDNGGYYMTSDYTPAAELGELALLHRVELAEKKIQIVDPSPNGTTWIDEATALLLKLSGPEGKAVDAQKFFWSRKSQRKLHCAALAELGLMRHEQKSA